MLTANYMNSCNYVYLQYYIAITYVNNNKQYW